MMPWEVGRLTPYQFRHVYGRPRDKEGRLAPVDGAGAGEAKVREAFVRAWRRRGLPPWRIAELWEEGRTKG